MAHLPGSLDSLVSNISNSPGAFDDIREWCRIEYGGGVEKFELLTRKGVYPYSYMDSMERFAETVLPPRPSFYNDLKEEECSG